MAAMEANALKSHLFWDDFIKILIRIDDKPSVILRGVIRICSLFVC